MFVGGKRIMKVKLSGFATCYKCMNKRQPGKIESLDDDFFATTWILIN